MKRMEPLKRNEQRKNDEDHTRTRTMGSTEVYDAKQENGFLTCQTTMHGINILKT